MAFLAEQGHNAIFTESYRTSRQALITKLEVEATRQLARARMEKFGGLDSKGGPASTAEYE